MEVVYCTQDKFAAVEDLAIFLAGPTSDDLNQSWRIEALKFLKHINFNGVVYVPEPSDGWTGIAKWPEFPELYRWEVDRLTVSDCIMFWIPRDFSEVGRMSDGSPKVSMPATNTNVEFGKYAHQENVVYGRPPSAPLMKYLDEYYKDINKKNGWERLIHTTLEETLLAAVYTAKIQHYFNTDHI